MVGLPARGKSIIAHKLESFLGWYGWRTKSFSAGATRRNITGQEGRTASFFGSANAQQREAIADSVMHEVLTYFETGGQIAIFDATNSSAERRQRQVAQVAAASERSGRSMRCVFIESIILSPALLFGNMLKKVRASPDFYGLDEQQALEDLKARIQLYEQAYCSCSEEGGHPFIKLYDISARVVTHHICNRRGAPSNPGPPSTRDSNPCPPSTSDSNPCHPRRASQIHATLDARAPTRGQI